MEQTDPVIHDILYPKTDKISISFSKYVSSGYKGNKPNKLYSAVTTSTNTHQNTDPRVTTTPRSSY